MPGSGGKCVLPGAGKAMTEARYHNYERDITGFKIKDLMMVPHRVAIALQDRGWWVRFDVVWNKPNPMPESVNGWRWEQHRVKIDDERVDCPGCDKCLPNEGLVLRKGSWRPTRSHEYIFQLVKNDKYFCDAEATKELSKYPLDNRKSRSSNSDKRNSGEEDVARVRPGSQIYPTKNRRGVWTITTKPYKGAHFATFPPELPEICIKASTSEKGNCPICGMPWAPIVLKDDEYSGDTGGFGEKNSKWKGKDKQSSGHRIQQNMNKMRAKGRDHENPFPEKKVVGWKPTCECVELVLLTSDFVVKLGHDGTFTDMRFLQEKLSLTKEEAKILLSAMLLECESGQGEELRIVWENILAEKERTKILLESLFPEIYSGEQGINEGVDKNAKRICLCSEEGSPKSNKRRLCSGASVGDGKGAWEISQKDRDCSSREWGKRRQQTGEFKGNGKERSRFDKEACVLFDLSSLRERISIQGEHNSETGILIPVIPHPEPSRVLDPFGGSGTTAAKAKELGRHGISLDLSFDYLKLAKQRIKGVVLIEELPLFRNLKK